MNGTWKLRFADVGAADVGTLFCAQLEISRQRYFCCGVPGVPEIFAAPPAVIAAESVAPANNALDPHETVTVQFPLQNFGTGATTNLVATLQPTGGVLAPSAPQNYGSVSPSGGPASRPFTFVVGGSCGDTVTAALQLQDGATDFGTVTFTFIVGTLPPPVANPASISIPNSGAATPYPSTVNVSGVTGPVTKVTATLHSLSHTFPGDIDVLLVGPGGQKVILMSDVGGGNDANNLTLTFEDGAPAVPATLVSGTFAPTNSGTVDPFPAPAPAAPYGAALSAFNGVDPNGTWQLFVVDDAGGDFGSFGGGWSLKFTAAPLCASQPCTLNCPGTVFVSTAPDQPGAFVTFPAPTLSGSCGVISTTPLSGTFFPIGTTIVNASSAASAATCAFDVVVTDVQPPSIDNLTVTPSIIRANNHKRIDVTVSYTSSDNSGNSSVCSLSVTSSEPLNGTGDGNTEADWEVIDATHVRLRAERSGNGTDRTYTITVTCVDAAGNSTSASTTVVVPHDNS
jgi:subtilisin-like proprotein convertase family protein/CheY-like chemotaxis protein